MSPMLVTSRYNRNPMFYQAKDGWLLTFDNTSQKWMWDGSAVDKNDPDDDRGPAIPPHDAVWLVSCIKVS